MATQTNSEKHYKTELQKFQFIREKDWFVDFLEFSNCN